MQRLLAPLSGDERALDVGCGAGALAYALAPLVGEVVGVLVGVAGAPVVSVPYMLKPTRLDNDQPEITAGNAPYELPVNPVKVPDASPVANR